MAPAKYDPAATATTITTVGDDLLCEIFLRLPSLPSLVRAALACRTFLHAVGSSPAFRRRFRDLHPPPLLGFFSDPYRTAILAFVPLRSRSDPDLADAVRGSDFLLTRLPEDSGNPGWEIIGCGCGYIVLHNENTKQIAAYNPLTQAMDIFPYPPRKPCHLRYHYLFHIVSLEEDQRSVRVVFVRRCRRGRQRRRTLARLSVFSSDSREWQCSLWVDTSPPQPSGDGGGGGKCILPPYTSSPVNEFDRLSYWKHSDQASMVVLNTVTLQLSRTDFPLPLKDIDYAQFCLGRTKYGKLCMVCVDDANTKMLAVWFWRASGDGVEKWVLGKTFPLNMFIDFTMYCPPEYDVMVQVVVVAVIDGFVYLSIGGHRHAECLISFCLESEKLSNLIEHTFDCNIHPYIMAWPPSLVCSKEDSETKVTVDGLVGGGLVGTAPQRCNHPKERCSMLKWDEPWR